MSISVQKSKKKSKTIGSFSYSDSAAGLSLSSNKLTGVTFNGNQVHFSGTSKGSKKSNLSFTVDATDNGTGSSDTLSIHVSNGYSASGNLTSGDIAIH